MLRHFKTPCREMPSKCRSQSLARHLVRFSSRDIHRDSPRFPSHSNFTIWRLKALANLRKRRRNKIKTSNKKRSRRMMMMTMLN
jgi:hypothetical protein